MKTSIALIALSQAIGLALLSASTAEAGGKVVDCSKGDSVQAEVDATKAPATVFIVGLCVEDVVVRENDDITLSGNSAATGCNVGDPSLSAGATIDGTITVDGVRARIEHLVVTGSGIGVDIVNRANVDLFCNDIADNQESGVVVRRSSNAVLRNNMVRGNGRREFSDPFIHFDSGLVAVDGATVQSDGNTYINNQWGAIAIERGSAFHNATFLPREPGHPPIAADKDIYIAKGASFADENSCLTAIDTGPVAIEAFVSSLVDLHNADICGPLDITANSAFRLDDGGGAIVGNVTNRVESLVRIRDRSGFADGRQTTFNGTLTCLTGSRTYFATVSCGKTCTGPIPGTCVP